MLPATFLAGMTLPLISGILLRRGAGEAAIGKVYAANTLGAIAGVVLAVLFMAFLFRESPSLLPLLIFALTLQTLTIALLIMGRQR